MKEKALLTPVQKYIKAESFGGMLLFLATALAVLWSNLGIYGSYDYVWQYRLGIVTEHFELVKPLILWINDGLMALFFFLLGLEIKREILIGELNALKKATLPVFAAIGGMLVPLLIYLTINQNPETQNGWGISMATDIAFSLAVLKLLGDRVPISLKVFLTAFAIIDDIGAVIVIAFFYSDEILWLPILVAGVMLLVLYTLSLLRIHSKFILLFSGVIIWVLFLKSGLHPTLAGLLLAFAVPIRQRISEHKYADKLNQIIARLISATNTNKLPVLTKNQIEQIDDLEEWTRQVQSPLQQLEHRLHNWVAFLIMPVFALSNAGIYFSSDMAIDFQLVTTIAVSLFLGKAIGVTLFSYVGIKLKLASLPDDFAFKQIIGIAILSGVGFTMSLFIGSLAFHDHIVYLNSTKIGIVIGSLVAAVIGYVVLKQGSAENKIRQPGHGNQHEQQ